MKHAGPAALDLLEPLLAQILKRAELKEKKRGIFYLKSKSVLHFHEDPEGLFADVCANGKDLRLRVSTQTERRALLATLKQVLGA